jgi:enediyne biosynthesis protein E4
MPNSDRRRWAVLVAVACCFGGGCRPSTPDTGKSSEPPWFVDVTAEVGIDFTHDPGPINDHFFMPQIIGSGAALFDFDNDGKLDILLLQNGGPKGAKNKLFRQQPDGKFKDVSAGSGLDFAGYCMGIAVADVNHDGLPDVYISEFGGGRLFLNKGGGKFEQFKSGLEDNIWGTAVSFLDYARDGWLDLVIVNYVDFIPNKYCTAPGGEREYCHPSVFAGTITRLFRNRGVDDKGAWLGFEERTEPAGLARTPGPGLGVLCADFNGDGWPDIFVANDARGNLLWINQRNGTFKEEALKRGLAFNTRGETQGNMGVAWGAVDRDGLPALFVTHLTAEQPGLWRQSPRGMFQDQAAAAGLADARWRGTGFGAAFADFDNNGDLDLALVNGRVYRKGHPTTPRWDAYAERNQLFVNDGTGRFRDISAGNAALCGDPNIARGLAVGDLDGDGGLDLLVTTVAGKARILRNVAPQRGHWLLIRALDGKRDAIGAEVRLQAGSRAWHRLVQPSYSYLCSNDPRAHFGLGVVDKIDFVEIQWPTGSVERFPCPKVDCMVEVYRGRGQPAPAK